MPTTPSILLVEDDPDFSAAVRDVLETAGYQVSGVARTCTAALELANRQTPDLAILDLQLDDEIDGVTLGFELTSLGVPIIYLTGDITIAIRQAYQIASDFLEKPLRSTDLLAAVKRSLEAQKPGGKTTSTQSRAQAGPAQG